MRHHESLKRLIPVPSLWHFYRFLRLFPRRGFHLEIAREMHYYPERLAEMCTQSAAHFALYDNHPKPSTTALPTGTRPKCLTMCNSIHPAERLVAKAADGAMKFVRLPDLAANYVDYELPPCRTTGSMPESGREGYGPGDDSIDLLLANEVDRLPAIGEVKAAGVRKPVSRTCPGVNLRGCDDVSTAASSPKTVVSREIRLAG